MAIERVCVYAGSLPGVRPEYEAAAENLVRLLGARGIGVVYGGGKVGLMGAVARAGLEAGVEVIGIIPEHLVARELAHEGLGELRVVRSMHERKALMAEMAGAFVALPGGIGTLEETIEMMTWAQLGLHTKPLGLLNVAGYYDPLVAFLDGAVREGFLPAPNRGLLRVADEPAALLPMLLDDSGATAPDLRERS
jgi:hypothetical protein